MKKIQESDNVAHETRTISGSVAAGASYATVGTYTVPAGENKTLIGLIIKGNANDPVRLEFNAGSNKNYPIEYLADDDPASRGNEQVIKLPTGIEVPANSIITAYASNSSAASVTYTIWLQFITK